MAKRESISVSFTPQQAAFLASCVKTGHYQSTSEVVREAIRLLEARQAKEHAQLQHVRQLVEEGARQLDAGEGVEWSHAMAALQAKHDRLSEG